jgi:hypothetical protein
LSLTGRRRGCSRGLISKQISNRRSLRFGQRHFRARFGVDIDVREFTDGRCFVGGFAKHCELVCDRTAPQATQPNADIDRFRKADRSQELALTSDAEPDRCLTWCTENSALDREKGQGRVEPAIVGRIVHVSVGITIGPAARDLRPPQEVFATLVARSDIVDAPPQLVPAEVCLARKIEGGKSPRNALRSRMCRTSGLPIKANIQGSGSSSSSVA